MRPRQGSAVKSLQVAGSVGRPVHDDQAAPLQDAIDDGFGQVCPRRRGDGLVAELLADDAGVHALRS